MDPLAEAVVPQEKVGARGGGGEAGLAVMIEGEGPGLRILVAVVVRYRASRVGEGIEVGVEGSTEVRVEAAGTVGWVESVEREAIGDLPAAFLFDPQSPRVLFRDSFIRIW